MKDTIYQFGTRQSRNWRDHARMPNSLDEARDSENPTPADFDFMVAGMGWDPTEDFDEDGNPKKAGKTQGVGEDHVGKSFGSSRKGWVTINGVHVLIGDDGIIEEGPSALIGQKPGSPNGKPSHPKLAVDIAAAEKFVESGRADGFRIHDLDKPLPKESANMWTDADEETMLGVSAHANLSNAIADAIFGENETTTGENYTNNIIENKGHPGIVILSGKTVDGPGSEVVIQSPKIAAVIGREELMPLFHEEAARMIKEGGGDPKEMTGLEPKEILREFSFDRRDRSQLMRSLEAKVHEIAKQRVRESRGS